MDAAPHIASIAHGQADWAGQARAQVSDNLRMLAPALHESLDRLLGLLAATAAAEAPSHDWQSEAGARLSALASVLELAGAQHAAGMLSMARDALDCDVIGVAQALWSLHDYLDALRDRSGDTDICDLLLFTSCRRLWRPAADADTAPPAAPVAHLRASAFGNALAELRADRGFAATLAALHSMETALSGAPELAFAQAFIARLSEGVQALDWQALSLLDLLGMILAAMTADSDSVPARIALARRRVEFLQSQADEQARRAGHAGLSQQMLKLMLLSDELQAAWDRCVGAGVGRIGAVWQWCESVLRAAAVSRRIWPRLRGPGLSGFLAALGRLAFDLAMSPRVESRDRELSNCLIFFDECLRRRLYLEEDFSLQLDCIVDHLAMLAHGAHEPAPFPWFSRELRADMARHMEGVVELEIKDRLEGVQRALETLWSPHLEATRAQQEAADHHDAAQAGDEAGLSASPAALIGDINTELALLDGLAVHLRSAEMRELAAALRRDIAADLPATLPDRLQDEGARRRSGAVRAHMVRDLVHLGDLLDQARRSPHNKWRRPAAAPHDPLAGAGLAADIRRALDLGDDAVSAGAGAPSEEAPAAPVQETSDDALGPLQPEERDPEMMEVFLTEARQIVVALQADLSLLASERADIELLNSVRRHFHTLKGSGRMVGLEALADAAQAMETLLNASLAAARASGRVDLSPPVAVLLEDARTRLDAWIVELAAGGHSRRQAPSLIAAAQALRNSMAVPQQPPPDEPPDISPAQVSPSMIAPGTIAQAVQPEPAPPVDSGAPGLREIFLKEARQLFKTLRQHGSSWRAKADSGLVVGAPPLYLRAAHTLRGCSAAAGFDGMRQMAGALDELLEQIKVSAAGLDGHRLAVVERAVAAIGEMLEQYAAGALPPAPPQPLAALEQLRQSLRRPSETGATGQSGQGAAVQERVATSTAVELQDEIDHELLPVFLEEGHDLLAAVGEGLQRFQRNPAATSVLAELRRPLHTVKGSARMTGALRLGHRMHELESGIQRLLADQEGAGGIDALLALFDQALMQFEALEQLSALPRADVAPAAPVGLTEGERRLASPLVRIKASVLDRLLNQVGEVSIARSQLENEVLVLHRSSQELADNIAKLSVQLRDIEIQAEIQIAASHQASSESAQFDPLELDRFTHLQELTRMMAESVNDAASLQKQLLESAAKTQEGLQVQGRLTRELQQELTYARMVKFRSLEQRLQHLARQLSNETGKQLQLEIAGAAVELDRSILERLVGPLEHLLRNAAVHGIEEAAERAAAGKPADGRLGVQVSQEGNEAVIRITDDGRGLDIEAIRRKAREQGLLSSAPDVQEEARLCELIFEPGFTTSSQVSALAGRGVGMDVVRSEVTALGGRITVQSTPGAGARFTMHLPLSLAVKQVCLLHHGGQNYAIPSMLVDKVVQLRGDEMRQALAEQALAANGRMVVLHTLHSLLDEPQEPSRLPLASVYVLFVKSGDDLVAIMVDQVVGNREVVAKPIGPQLDTLVGVVGATVLGNGEIALIINPLLLASRIGARRLGVLREVEALAMAAGPQATQKMVMVVDDSLTVRKIMQRLLEREGYAVASATDGYDAIRQLHNVAPDVFLVDIEMPRMDGFTLVRHLRDNESTRAKPIVMITSRTGAKHRERAMEVGVNYYLGKPYQDEQLLELLRHYASDSSQRPADDFSDVLY